MPVEPTPEQLEEFLRSDVDGEIVMLNLLKFSDDTETYGRYQSAAESLVQSVGGRIQWIGLPRHVLVGDPSADDWDAVATVTYPSRQAFLAMISHPDYAPARRLRQRGLARTALICCATAPTTATHHAPRPE
ncbi:DUF1330 domain-containing protein [Streptomyces sp. NPDC002004]